LKKESQLKKRKTDNYIVVGTAHQGMDLSVLRAVKTAADYHDAKVIHVGPLATKDEIAMWRRREKKLRTWEKTKSEKVKNKAFDIQDKVEVLSYDIDDLKEEMKHSSNEERSKLSEKLQKLKESSKKLTDEEGLLWERLGEDTERLRREKEELEKIQWGRISSLLEVFGDVTFVCNDELHVRNIPLCAEDEIGLEPLFDTVEDEYGDMSEIRIPWSVKDALGEHYKDKQLLLGTHLFVTAVPANGEKMAGMPITPRTFRMLKAMGHSHIVPHMTPHIKPFARPGLNQAYNYWTTGAIQICDQPKRVSDAYKSSSRTGCILVSVDRDNGEFHAQRLRAKLFSCEKSHKTTPHILHDGVVFDTHGTYLEVESEDKASHMTDIHYPHHHMGVIGASRALSGLHRPSLHVDGGDTVDFQTISPHTRNKPLEREGLRFVDDVEGLAWTLDATSNFPWIKKKVLLDSNHGEWVTKLVEENPYLKGIADWETIAKKFLPEWEVFIRKGGDDKFYKFGDLTMKHADREGTITKANDVYGNYLGGHHHSFQEFGDAVFAGPGAKLGPKYLQNSATSWQNQSTTITKYRGQTCKHPKTIFHTEGKKVSRFAYRGQIYEVKYHKKD